MHDPEKFQQATFKAITDLQEATKQTQSRLLAASALLQAVVNRVPLAALPSVIEEFELIVDQQASQLPREHQHPESWEKWSTYLEARLQQLRQAANPPTTPPN